MQINPPPPALQRARQQLLETGDFPPGVLDERLARSWQRSLAAGLSPFDRSRAAEPLCAEGLSQALARNQQLLAHARPVMEYLFAQLRHSQSMVILADQQGALLHTLGEGDFLDKAQRVVLTAGASWHERERGTNAIGTALAEAAGVEIHGSEHFLERNAFLTCAAAPIVSSRGELLGVLDISSDQARRHPHTLGLVSTAAAMIENALVVASCRRQLRLHLHPRPEGIGSVAEGIVVLSDDGWIVGANRQGLAMLHLTTAELGATQLERIVAVQFDRLVDSLSVGSSRKPGAPREVRLHDGSALFAVVHAEQPALASQPEHPNACCDALAKLDTGDLRWRNATDKARRVAGRPIPLLIQGESGVGKELFARATHDSGPRREGPFIAINCAALPENLIEAELFGYGPGAFTGAQRGGSLGRLREAQGGTLFLDEIGDMPLAMQSRLLRVLQERQVSPLGGGRAVAVDFALICATHRKLREAAERGSFRSDLYYRINGLTLILPALRERSDFPALSERLLADLNPGRAVHLAPPLLAQFARHRWPGNLRQYASVLRTASAMLDADEDCIEWHHLPDDLVEELAATPPSAPAAASASAPLIQAAQNLEQLSRSAIHQALASCRGNISEAARRLGISRQTLYRKLNA